MYKVPARPPLVLLHLLVLGPAVLEPDGDGVEVEVRATGEILDHARVRVLGVARETLFEYFDLGEVKQCDGWSGLERVKGVSKLCSYLLVGELGPFPTVRVVHNAPRSLGTLATTRLGRHGNT